LLLVSRLRIGRSLRSRLVNGKIHEVHFGVHVSAPPDGLGQSGYGNEGIVSRDSDQTLMASARFGPRPCRRETDPSSSIRTSSTRRLPVDTKSTEWITAPISRKVSSTLG